VKFIYIIYLVYSNAETIKIGRTGKKSYGNQKKKIFCRNTECGPRVPITNSSFFEAKKTEE